MMIGPTREDSKVVSQGELWELWNQDSNQPCWASLSPFAFLPGSFCLRLSLSFPLILSLFSLTLSVSVFLFLPSLTLSATLALSPTFFCFLSFSLFNSSLSFL